MQDGIAHARSLSLVAADATARFGSAVRRWLDGADAARFLWDDTAGRTIFQQFLEPHRSVLDAAGLSIGAAAESCAVAMDHVSSAADAAASAGADAPAALVAAQRARQQG